MIHFTKIFIFILILTLTMAFADNSYLIRVSGNNIYLRNDTIVTSIYQNEFGRYKNLYLHYQSNLISFIEIDNVENAVTPAEEREVLTIIDLSGNVVKKIDQKVQQYAWNNRGTQLSLISGIRKESDSYYETKKIFIYDIAGDKLEELALTEKFKETRWAPGDSLLLLKKGGASNKIFSYNTNSGLLRETNYTDFYFSIDGYYYYRNPNYLLNENDVAVFRSYDNKKIELPKNLKHYTAICWLSENRLVVKYMYPSQVKTGISFSKGIESVVDADVKFKYLVIDINNGTILSEQLGYAHSWKSSENQLYISDGKHLVRISSTYSNDGLGE